VVHLENRLRCQIFDCLSELFTRPTSSSDCHDSGVPNLGILLFGFVTMSSVAIDRHSGIEKPFFFLQKFHHQGLYFVKLGLVMSVCIFVSRHSFAISPPDVIVTVNQRIRAKERRQNGRSKQRQNTFVIAKALTTARFDNRYPVKKSGYQTKRFIRALLKTGHQDSP